MYSQNKVAKLINSLEYLSHNDRIYEIIELGRREKDEPEIVKAIDNLERGNNYEKLLTLYSCHGSYNGERVIRAIKDSSRNIRSKGINLISLVGSDEQVLAALNILNFKQRRILLEWLRKRKRFTVIDSFLTKLIEQEETRIDELLIYGTAEIVNLHLDKNLENIGINEWEKLVELHPEIAINVLHKYSAINTAKNYLLVGYFNECISRLAQSCPDSTFKLIEKLLDNPLVDDLYWKDIVYFYPVEVAKLVLCLDKKIEAYFYLDHVADKLPQNILIDLITKKEIIINHNSYWLEKLKLEKRTAIYKHCSESLRNKNGFLPIYLIKLFPAAIREKEARYNLELRDLYNRPNLRFQYASLLPWDEAKEIIEPYLKSTYAKLRILALETIIDTTRYYRNRLSELLKIIQQHSHEQDSVKSAILYSLASLPPSIWQQEHLTDLEIILTDALKATDMSTAIANYAQRIVIAILPFHPQWSAEWLTKLAEVTNKIDFYHLENILNTEQLKQLIPILLPVFKSWEREERERNIISAATSFGKRLEVFDDLVDILARILHNTTDKSIATSILNILSEYRKDRFVLLIPQLLQQDKSWFTNPVVNNYLHNRRQDSLTPFLEKRTYQGKFSTGETVFFPDFNTGFARWTFQQQTIYAQYLDSLTRDEIIDISNVETAIERLSLLPAIKPTRLIELASLQNPQEAVRNFAIRALRKLDGAEGVPVLLSALDDARARIAIYPLCACLIEMPIDTAVDILQNIDWNKITVAKEIICLSSNLPLNTVEEELLVCNEDNLHCDGKIALLRSFLEYLEKKEGWEILEKITLAPDETVVTTTEKTVEYTLSEIIKIILLAVKESIQELF